MEEKERLLKDWKNTQQKSDSLYRDYSIAGNYVFLTLSPFPPKTEHGFYIRCAFTSERVQKVISILNQVCQHQENQIKLNECWKSILANLQV